MQTRHAEGYLLAVALFLVCCWVNPNDAIPYRTRRQANEQVNHWVGNTAEIKAVNVTDRPILQPDVGADVISDLSGGGTKWTTSQRPRSHRSRLKNLIMNANMIIEKTNQSSANLSKINQLTSRLPSIVDAATQDASKTGMELALITEAMNCSERHNANDKYSSSFNENFTTEILNDGDDFQATGEAGTKKTTSVLVGEDITLCWIETTTIKEDRSFHPVQRFVIREYTISFENSATIPERYLECVQLEGEIDTKNNSIPRSTFFEIMDEDTRHSRVVNFTTVSHSDDLTVWQHRRVRCGVGPVVTKNIIEWADDRSENTKKRVEIKVSPKIHRLTAQPTDTEPYTTDLVDPQLTSSPPANLASPVDCGPGVTCGSYNDCVDENCGYSTTPSEGLTSLDLQEVTTQLYMTTPADDHESNELLSTSGLKESLLVTDEMIDSSGEITTPILVITETSQEEDDLSTVALVEVTTILDDESETTTSDVEISNSTESGTVFGITMVPKTNISMEIGNQEVEMLEISHELSLSSSEIDDSSDSNSEDLTASAEDASNSETEFSDSITRTDDETRNTEDFTTTPTTDASKLTTEHATYYLTKDEHWETTTGIAESKSTNLITETIENNSPSVRVTEDSNTVTEIMGSGSTTPETTESNTMMTKLTDRSIAIPTEPSELIILTQCDYRYDDCAESFEDQTTTDDGSAITEVTTTSTILGGETITEEATTNINAVIPEVMEPETRSHDKATAEEIISDTGGATTEVTISLTTLGGKAIAEESTIDINEAALEAMERQIRLDGETTTEEATTDLNDAISEITASSTIEEGQSKFTVSSSRRTTQTLTGIHTGESTTDIDDPVTVVTTYTTDSSESRTGIVSSMTIKQSLKSTDSSEMCDNIGTGNCPVASEITDVPPTTTSTSIEVEKILTTVSDVPISRSSTTVEATSKSQNSKHKLALKIKILLEHIDENKNKQKLVEVEKHLLFNAETNKHGRESLIKQLRALNNTISMQTIQALFNCSNVEKLTGDVSDFAAKCFTLRDETPHDEESKIDFNSIKGVAARGLRDSSSQGEREVARNLEMSLPGIHDDIHAGLSHVMTWVPPEHEPEQQNMGMSEEKNPHSRLLEVVADPQDERVHARKKRQTIDDLTIDQLNLPKDVEEVGRWSTERVRRAMGSGHVRTLTEFTIYKDP